jgi:hypothetical protein
MLLVFSDFLISKFRRVVNVVRFLLGNSAASQFYMLTLAYKIQTPGDYPEESVQHLVTCLRMAKFISSLISAIV